MTLQLRPCSAEKDPTCSGPHSSFHHRYPFLPSCLCALPVPWDPWESLHATLHTVLHSHSYRGLQRRLWICWSASRQDVRCRQGHKEANRDGAKRWDRFPWVMELRMHSKKYHPVDSQPPPHNDLNFSISVKLQIFSQNHSQLLVSGPCIVCFDYVCGFFMVEARCLLRQLAWWSSYFPKPLDLNCS